MFCRYLAQAGPGYWRETRRKEPQATPARILADIWAGYDPLEASWYRQAGQDPARLVSNFHRQHVLNGVNGGGGLLLSDKLLFAHLARSHGWPHPQVFGHAGAAGMIWFGNGEEAARERLAAGRPVVAKGIRGKKGRAIRIHRGGTLAEALPPPGWMLTDHVRQADYAEAIHPGALNTVRVLTVSPAPGRVELAAAAHRFGASATGVVDNFSAGGLVSRIDLRTGRLDAAISLGPGNRLVWNTRHPESGGRIEGVAVARWDEVLRLARALAIGLPWLRYVGWDIAVTDTAPVVIEGNAHPSLRFFQVFGPIAWGPLAAEFLARHVPAGRILRRPAVGEAEPA